MALRALLLTTGLTLAVTAPWAAAAPGPTAFQSPSGNIGCFIGADAVRCDIRAHDWPTPKKPSSCDVDYGQGLQVGPGSTRGSFVCAGDTTLGSGRKLAYGRSITRGHLWCTSRASGMTCRNARDHGFTLSRKAAQRF